VSIVVTYDADTHDILLAVMDEGVGMTEQVKARILEPFFSTKLEHGGTGLGLYISHSILSEHKGSLHFTSEPGVGTTVTVRIPVPHGKAEHNESR
jgi:signal transduction histidine kinase